MFLKDFFVLFHRHLRPFYWKLLLLGLLSMIPGVLLSVRPLAIAPILSQILPGKSTPVADWRHLTLDNAGVSLLSWLGPIIGSEMGGLFIAAAFIYLLATCISAALSAFINIASLGIRMRVFSRMVATLHSHMLNLDMGFFAARKSGELISRFNLDLARAATSIDTVIMKLVQTAAQIIVSAWLLVKTDTLLTLFIFGLGGLHLGVSRAMGAWVRRTTQVASSGQAELTASLQESFQNIHVTKVFAAESYDSKRVATATEQVRLTFFRFMLTRYVEQPIRLVTDGVVMSGILGMCYYVLSSGRISLGGMALFFYMAGQLVQPMSEFGREILGLYGLHGNVGAVMDIIRTRPAIADGIGKPDASFHALEMRNVHFEYERGRPVLDGVNLQIQKGEMVAVVGPSGSGKSTLVSLLLRLYDPRKGSVCMNGCDIRGLQQGEYRRLFGVVNQDCLLFHTSIRENIVLGRLYDESALKRACQIANILEYIEGLPSGMDTIVGERGVRLSGGQRQRIAIARAVYERPQILVLDEATSSLDTESERLVQRAIEHALEGTTGVVIAHRLSTIAHATKIVVMNAGQIESVGQHEELIKHSPTYRRLQNLQVVEAVC